MIDGTLYSPNGIGLVEAFEPESGRLVWLQEPADPGIEGVRGVQSARSVAYWRDGDSARILSVRGNYLYALDARTGKPIVSFGVNGRVDLRPGLSPETTNFNWTAPSPIVVRGTVIVGGQGRTATQGEANIPPGDIRGYDVKTGTLRWQFHIVPRAGEYGVEFTYASRPNWMTYASLLDFAARVVRDQRDLGPRDMIDAQSFIWVQGSDEYEE